MRENLGIGEEFEYTCDHSNTIKNRVVDDIEGEVIIKETVRCRYCNQSLSTNVYRKRTDTIK